MQIAARRTRQALVADDGMPTMSRQLLTMSVVAWSMGFTPAVMLRASDVVDEQLDAMAASRSKFDPQQLDQMGAHGLSLVLDRLFPETASQPVAAIPEEQIKLWIHQLGDDDFERREAATRNLIANAWFARELVKRSIDTSDTEVRQRIRFILDSWVPKSRERWKPHLEGLSNYLLKIKDLERLDLLAQRVTQVLDRGVPMGDDRKLPRLCLAAIAKGARDESCELLRPLLKHDDVAIAVIVAEEVGSQRDIRFFPQLLVDALQDDRDEVADAALDWAPNCWDEKRAPLVQKAIRRLFDERSEKLKFHACFTLMHDYHDPDAIVYLLEQTKSDDEKRAFTAISWIGDACNWQTPVTKSILDHLTPHLTSNNDTLRRAASAALGTYRGEEVVRVLIPMLGDATRIIAEEAQRNLPNQKDKEMLRRQLADAVENSPNSNVRSRCQQLLAKLKAK